MSEQTKPSTVGQCPTCRLNWTSTPPVKCFGEDYFLCIECKAIYTAPMLAADEMLLALQLVERRHATSPHIGVVRAAIAKAKGGAS